jgi:hypothetical protein
MPKSQHKLQLDARLWLEMPETPRCHISQVVTIKIHQEQLRLDLQRWEWTRRDFGSTRSGQPRHAVKTDEVQVTLVDNVPVATGSFRLSFSKLLERHPAADSLEGDIIFTPEDLAAIAKEVWSEQRDLIPPGVRL